jgi:putative ABC transport system ATP-binding protein
MGSLVRLQDVHRSYHRGDEAVHALRGVSFSIEPREFVVITGPSGSGKSTLLHVMAGLDRPSSGEVLLEDKPLSEMPDDELTLYRRRRLGFIFQFFHLLPTLSAAENVALPLLLDGKPPSEATRIARERLEPLGLGPRADHRPRELSGGEQQRVAIARALVADPALLLADEPTGNLDSAAGGDVYSILAELPSRFGTAIVMVTHDQSAVRLGTRALHIVDGKLAPSQG